MRTELYACPGKLKSGEGKPLKWKLKPPPSKESGLGGAEGFADGAEDGVATEGFRQQRGVQSGLRGFGGGEFAVAGHVDDGQTCTILLEAGGGTLAAHAGHDHVGDQEIDRAGGRRGEGHGGP